MYDFSIFPGLGIHQWNFQLKNMSRFLYVRQPGTQRSQFEALTNAKYVHIWSIFFGLTLMCLKTAILMEWLRLFVPRKRSFLSWALHFLIWANVVFYGSGTIIEIWRCIPREKIWNPLHEGGSCPIDIEASDLSYVSHAKRIGV